MLGQQDNWGHADSVAGNYDINKLHYEGSGDGQGYGYDIRVQGKTSAVTTEA